MSNRPVWLEIRETLERELREERYPPGARFPTEQALAARFSVNRHTVRRAIKALSEAGLLHVRRGAGAKVTGRRIDYALSERTSFSKNLIAAGCTPSRENVRLETLPADENEAAMLGIGRGASVVLIEAILRADNLAIGHSRIALAAERLPGIAEAMADEPGVTKALARIGVHDYRRASTRITAVLPDPAVARHMEVDPAEPVLFTVSIDALPDGTPIAANWTSFVGTRITMVLGAAGSKQALSFESLMEGRRDA